MSTLSLEHLISLDFGLKVAVACLTVLTAIVAAGSLYVGRELDQRREAESVRVRLESQAAHQKAEAADQAAERLRTRFAPRVISPEQREVLLTVLKELTGTVKVIYPSDEEAQMFAQEIALVLTAAGWHVSTEGGPSFGPVFGFLIQVRGDDVPSYVGVLEHGLGKVFANEPLARQIRAFAGDERVRLQVGMKRQLSPGDK